MFCLNLDRQLKKWIGGKQILFSSLSSNGIWTWLVNFISKPLNWRADPETQLDLLNNLCPFQFANWCTGRGNSNDSGRWRCFNGKNIDNLIDISLTEKWNASQNNLYLFHCQMLFRVFIIRWVIISCYQFFFVLIGCWNWKWKNGGKKYIYKNHGCNTYSLIADKIGTNNIMKPRE